MSVLLEDRLALPSIGHEIPRPSSTSTLASYSQERHGSHASIQLPALSTLASVASSRESNGSNGSNSGASVRGSPPKMPSPPPQQQSKLPQGHSMTYATSAPATAGGQPNSPPVCQNCATSTTPLWRRDESGSVLCNACGLFLKLHGRPRPISLKTDVIKSRNRVKTGGAGGRRKTGETNGLPAAHPDADPHHNLNLALAQHRRTSGKISSGLSDRSPSPLSRTGTPGFPHHSNIAPQHLFDTALHPDAFTSGSLPGFQLRHPSPSATSSVNGSHLEPPLSYDALIGQNTNLRTRVSELEVINGLFRGRVNELETSETETRHVADASRETEAQLRAELDASRQREAELKRRIEELEQGPRRIEEFDEGPGLKRMPSLQLEEFEEGPRHKRIRFSDVVDESRTGTPVSLMGESNSSLESL